jgi:hypothetical protein
MILHKLVFGGTTASVRLWKLHDRMGSQFVAAQSFYSHPINNGSDGIRWVELEVIMIRLNVSYAPHGSFAVHSPNER